MFFTIIIKNIDKSNEIIKLSHEMRSIEGTLIKELSCVRTDVVTNLQNVILEKIKYLVKEIDKNEIIKNINDIKNILEQTSVILNINDNDNENDNKIILETKLNQNIEETNYNIFKKKLSFTYFSEDVKKEYDKIKSLIEKYKDLILFIEEIKRRCKQRLPKDRFIIKLNIRESSICEYYILGELSDFDANKNIYQDENILTNKDYSGFELFLDNIMKKIINRKSMPKKEIEKSQQNEGVPTIFEISSKKINKEKINKDQGEKNVKEVKEIKEKK